ncbi:TetR/AcrR family transcriptional regulator [Gelidibacter sp. F2691]|nr:TetR/AcrR family transcriptional regulator [Gelidibacter sp. F2691]
MNTRKSSSDRKAEILTTTLELAFEVGPDHVTTGMIAGRLGLSQPAIYKHFPKKEDVWQAAAQSLCERIGENTRRGSVTDRSAIENLRLLVLSHLHLVTEIPALPEIMVTRDPTGSLTTARQQIQRAMSDFRAAVTQALERIRTAGQMRAGLSTDDSEMLVFGIIQSLILRLIVTRDPAPLVPDGKRLLDLQLMLFSDEGSAP